MFKSFLNFKKPEFIHLDYIDIIVEEKSLFLIAWKLNHRYRIHIHPTNKTCRHEQSAVMVKIPANAKEMIITLHSFWRKNKYRLPLKKVQLDQSSADYLIRQFKPFIMPVVTMSIASRILPIRNLRLPSIQMRQKGVTIKSKGLVVKTPIITHITKINKYE